MKEMIGHSGENLRQSMVTPWNVNEPISAEEFQQQAEVMKEVSIVYSFRYSPIGDGARGARAPLSLHTNVSYCAPPPVVESFLRLCYQVKLIVNRTT